MASHKILDQASSSFIFYYEASYIKKRFHKERQNTSYRLAA